MFRMLKVLNARSQNWQANHFAKTRYGRKISEMKDQCVGQKCFVVGNGPSLRPEDLDLIMNAGIPSFGMNRIFYIFPKTRWRPTYYVSEDILILRDIQEEVSAMKATKFIPVNLKWYEGIEIKDAIYFKMDYHSELPETFGMSLDAANGVRCHGTVTTTCIQLAIYMGYSEIYLLGIDHKYSTQIDNDGNIIADQQVKDYFIDGYDSDIKSQVIHDMREPTKAYACVEQLSRKMKSFRVFNATRGGNLEIFERRCFDSIVNKK